jgi:hypothetical protein
MLDRDALDHIVCFSKGRVVVRDLRSGRVVHSPPLIPAAPDANPELLTDRSITRPAKPPVGSGRP